MFKYLYYFEIDRYFFSDDYNTCSNNPLLFTQYVKKEHPLHPSGGEPSQRGGDQEGPGGGQHRREEQGVAAADPHHHQRRELPAADHGGDQGHHARGERVGRAAQGHGAVLGDRGEDQVGHGRRPQGRDVPGLQLAAQRPALAQRVPEGQDAQADLALHAPRHHRAAVQRHHRQPAAQVLVREEERRGVPVPGVPALRRRDHRRHRRAGGEAAAHRDRRVHQAQRLPAAAPEQRGQGHGLHPGADRRPEPARDGRHPAAGHPGGVQEEVQGGPRAEAQAAQDHHRVLQERLGRRDPGVRHLADHHQHVVGHAQERAQRLHHHPHQHGRAEREEGGAGPHPGHQRQLQVPRGRDRRPAARAGDAQRRDQGEGAADHPPRAHRQEHREGAGHHQEGAGLRGRRLRAAAHPDAGTPGLQLPGVPPQGVRRHRGERVRQEEPAARVVPAREGDPGQAHRGGATRLEAGTVGEADPELPQDPGGRAVQGAALHLRHLHQREGAGGAGHRPGKNQFGLAAAGEERASGAQRDQRVDSEEDREDGDPGGRLVRHQGGHRAGPAEVHQGGGAAAVPRAGAGGLHPGRRDGAQPGAALLQDQEGRGHLQQVRAAHPDDPVLAAALLPGQPAPVRPGRARPDLLRAQGAHQPAEVQGRERPRLRGGLQAAGGGGGAGQGAHHREVPRGDGGVQAAEAPRLALRVQPGRRGDQREQGAGGQQEQRAGGAAEDAGAAHGLLRPHLRRDLRDGEELRRVLRDPAGEHRRGEPAERADRVHLQERDRGAGEGGDAQHQAGRGHHGALAHQVRQQRVRVAVRQHQLRQPDGHRAGVPGHRGDPRGLPAVHLPRGHLAGRLQGAVEARGQRAVREQGDRQRVTLPLLSNVASILRQHEQHLHAKVIDAPGHEQELSNVHLFGRSRLGEDILVTLIIDKKEDTTLLDYVVKAQDRGIVGLICQRIQEFKLEEEPEE